MENSTSSQIRGWNLALSGSKRVALPAEEVVQLLDGLPALLMRGVAHVAAGPVAELTNQPYLLYPPYGDVHVHVLLVQVEA